jgi:hypothetical protein
MDVILDKLKSELLTKLNVLATVILLWIINQPGAPTDKVLEFLPASWAQIVTLVLPLLWAVVVQFAIKELKEREPDTPAEPVA